MYANEVKRADLKDDTGTPAYVIDSDASATASESSRRRRAHHHRERQARRRLPPLLRLGKLRDPLQDVYGGTLAAGTLGSIVEQHPRPTRATVTDAGKHRG